MIAIPASTKTPSRVISPTENDSTAAPRIEDENGTISSNSINAPRLSLLEALILVIPRMQKYEDDLRDQWRSRTHRDEWRRLSPLVAKRRQGMNSRR